MLTTEKSMGTGAPRRMVVGISGASGVIYGVRILSALKELGVETHLVISAQAQVTLQQETDLSPDDVAALTSYNHAPDDLAAPIASGSFVTDGMIVAPCSMKTLSAIANSYADNLLVRAADVTLKEGRTLLLVVRETPLHVGHLRLMVRAAEIGAVIFPPVPAFYGHPQTVSEVVDQTVGRILARMGIGNRLYKPWEGPT
ncbi:MAG: UbiX family flavin prenyltransferase [Anaerolineales bacterium]|nr:MAG: UbiX family flavin prenyltransferase [Anaerolineales bacterium]